MSVRSFRRAHARRSAQAQSRLGRRGRLVAGLAVSGSLLLTPAALANTYQVTTTGDDAGSTSHCVAPVSPSTTYTCVTLRDAITDANATSTANTITFASGVTGTIDLGATLDITGDGGLTITGPGASSLAISGQGNYQDILFDASNSSVPEAITGLTITDGSVSGYGGAIGTDHGPNLVLANDTISDSKATGTSPEGEGGGVFSSGNLVVVASTFKGNTSTGSGGGLATEQGETSVTDSQFLNNTSGGGGGGLSAEGAESAISISGSTFSGNTAQGGAGFLLENKYGQQIIKNTVVTGNTAQDFGGALIGSEIGTSRLIDSTISDNHAQDGGGLVDYSIGGNTQIDGSTISGNTASGGSGSEAGELGGLTLVSFDGAGQTGSIVDSTISGNTASRGAGVSIITPKYFFKRNPYESTIFTNSTIAGNTASQHAGGIYLVQTRQSSSGPYYAPNVELDSTIVGDNTAAGISDDIERGSKATTGTVSANYSLIESPGTVPLLDNESLLGIDPQLGPLQDNGGPTDTMLPSGTSPVIDQGKAPADLTIDQRGDPRTVDTAIPNAPGGDGTDIGAVELAANQVVVPPTPSSGTTLSIHGSGLNLSSSPLLVGSQTPVTCSVKAGVLHNCVIEIRNAAGTLLGSGEVTSSGGASSLTTEVTTTTAGARYLKSRQLGTPATATLTASQTAAGSPIASGSVTYLAGPSITVGLGARSSKLSKGVISELGRVAKLLAGTTSFTCTAYTSPGKSSLALTKTVAGSACGRLKRDGLSGTSRAVGKGSTGQVASNRTKKGQAANRRLVISFRF